MRAPQFCVSCGGRCPATADGGSCCFARTVTRRAVTSTAGSGTAFRDGRTESGVSVGDAVHALGCATHPKAGICVLHACFALSETYQGRSRGFLTCLCPSMIPASTRLGLKSRINRSRLLEVAEGAHFEKQSKRIKTLHSLEHRQVATRRRIPGTRQRSEQRICVRASCFGHSETCRALSRGFPTSLPR